MRAFRGIVLGVLIGLAIWAIILLMVNFCFGEETENIKCSDCPQDKPCEYSFPAGDGCNTCTGNTWCKVIEICMDTDKKICSPYENWYSDGLAWCTLINCNKTSQIPNPFKK